MHVVLVYLQ